MQLITLQLNSITKLLEKFWDQSQIWISFNKEIHIWYRICDLWENFQSKVPLCNALEDIYVQGMMSYCLRFIRGSWTCLIYTFFPGQSWVIFSLQFWAVESILQFNRDKATFKKGALDILPLLMSLKITIRSFQEFYWHL